MARDWEDTLRTVGALVNAEGLILHSLNATPDGLLFQGLNGLREPLLAQLSEATLDAMREHARAMREGASLNWKPFFLAPGAPVTRDPRLSSRNYALALREVGRHIDSEGMTAFAILEDRSGFTVSGYRPRPGMRAGITVWSLERNVWPDAVLVGNADEAKTLRGRVLV